tara:strand:+ start:171 stop:470 length:300 start_codon:yes stop_codon:yes gene_type:complete
MDRERVIEEIQKINCNQRNNIFELAILDNKELSERLNELNKNKKMEREIAVNQIVLPTSYIRNEDGSITYDFEMMAEEFENELSKLDDSVVVMCSVEGK